MTRESGALPLVRAAASSGWWKQGSGGALRGAEVLALCACVVTLFVLFVRVLTHNVFFDESFHLHYLWLLSVGSRAYSDFFCQYPVTGYYAALPLFRLLPESAYVVLLLRLASVAVVAGTAALLGLHARRVTGSWTWGSLPLLMAVVTTEMSNFLVEYNTDVLAMAAAAGAFVTFASPPRARSVGIAAALSFLSVMIMPKYALILFLGGLGFLVAAGREGGWRPAIVWGSAGAALAVGAVWALLSHHDIPIGEMVALVGFQSRWTIDRSDLDHRIAEVASHFLRRHGHIGVLAALGIAGWLASSRREILGRHLPLAGLLAGTILYAFRVKSVFEQMLFPVVLTLVFFVPYALRLLPPSAGPDPSVRRRPWPEFALAAAALTAACFGFNEARGDFRLTSWGRDPQSPYVKWPAIKPGIETLHDIDSLLKFIPANEPVVALWFRHPLFRRDLTYVTLDEQDSFTRTMPPDHPARRFFDPGYFKEALERTPPAYISLLLLDRNYPPGWERVCLDFLERHAEAYTRFTHREGDTVYVRNDLLGH